MAATRMCIYCDQEVKEPVAGERVFGRGEVPKGYVHNKSSQDGVPSCRHATLEESETYTVEYSAPKPSSEY